MKVLLDNGVPDSIAPALAGHFVVLSRRVNWHQLANGELISKAEAEGFDVLVTTDKNIRYQQNLTQRKIALVVLGRGQWPAVKHHLDRVSAAVDASAPGAYVEVDIPAPLKLRDIR